MSSPIIPPFQSILDSGARGIRQAYVAESSPTSGPETGDAAILRRYLTSAGINSEGQSLKAAVTAFQRDHNANLGEGGVPLQVDGKAGTQTLEMLRQRLQTFVGRGATENSKDLQAFLKYQPVAPNLNAAKPDGAVTGAQVLSQSGDAGKRAQLERKLADAMPAVELLRTGSRPLQADSETIKRIAQALPPSDAVAIKLGPANAGGELKGPHDPKQKELEAAKLQEDHRRYEEWKGQLGRQVGGFMSELFRSRK